jgi:hypothetical protein
MFKCTVMLLLLMSVQQNKSEKSKPHVYDPDILESLRLDMMYLESRVGGAVKAHSDRVVAAMAQQEEKMKQAFDKLVEDLKMDMQKAAKQAVTGQSSVKVEPSLGYQDLGYWWSWWQATWNQPLSIFFLGFSLYQAENKFHKLVFFVMGFAYSPHLGGFALIVIIVRAGLAAWLKAKQAVQDSYCGRCCCPRSDAEADQDAEMGEASEPRLRSVRVVEAAGPAILEPATGNDSVFERSGTVPQGPLSFWAYARAALSPFSYLPLGARASVDSW